MTTLDLRQRQVTVDELLELAIAGSVRILARDGHEFILEGADEFEKEVAQLGGSDKFMRFLKERSDEKATIPLEQIARTLRDG
jgi:hypothetical protein